MCDGKMKIKLPEGAEIIINELEKRGHEAYIVGGCVRDAAMGKIPHDWDITTSAKPWEIKKIFKRTADTGIEHGTITVIIRGMAYEVTTYRIDGTYGDGRHPESVTFTSDLREDLKRRDFTINAMAYGSKTGLIDIFGGISDIGGKIIRCVGKPHERFSEDALRIMRAVRFSAQLDFDIDEDTYRAIIDMAGSLAEISIERIRSELDGLLAGKRPDKILMLRDMGIMRFVIPEFAQNCITDMEWNRIAGRLSLSPENRNVRWACLLYEQRDDSEKILRALKLDNRTVNAVSTIVKHADDMIERSGAGVRKNARAVYAGLKCGADLGNKINIYREYIMFRETCEKYDIQLSGSSLSEKGACAEEIRMYYKKIIDERHCLSTDGLNISGNDLKELGIEQGKQMGVILNELLEIVLENPELNTAEFLRGKALGMMKKC